jgi:glutamyl-tRNA reductase
MSLRLLGVNHKSAPVELRERLAIPEDRLVEATRLLASYPGVREGMILSTCNRVELLTSQDAPADGIGPDLLVFLGDYFSIEPASLRPHLYEYREQDAMRHLFRVASSLDSMVVGEPQILGQVKQSYSVARQVGAMNGELDRVLRRALTVAKRVRTETKIGASSISIATVAVELARKIFGSLQGKTICLVGTGKMGQQAARYLMKQGPDRLILSNRTLSGAEKLAEELHAENLPVEVLPFERLMDTLDADIVITSTGSQEPVFRREHGQMLLHRRRNRPVFFIDIAVPRDVDPAMQKLEGIFVYDVDDLQNVASQNRSARVDEAMRAHEIVERELEKYEAAKKGLNATPAIVSVQQSLEELRQRELERHAAQIARLGPEERKAVDDITRSIVKKMLHGPLTALKTAALEGDAEAMESIRAALTRNRAEGDSE